MDVKQVQLWETDQIVHSREMGKCFVSWVMKAFGIFYGVYEI